MVHVELPSGAIAKVAKNIDRRTLEALDEMTRAAQHICRDETCPDFDRHQPHVHVPIDPTTDK